VKEKTMSIAALIAALANEVGVSTSDVLREAGLDPESAVRKIADELGVDLRELALSNVGPAIEITDSDVSKVREGLAVLNRTFG
jgi:pyruvate/2-oxoglutarate dehydrogenase complex dihydrolipoamide acyltransferase (E2) component